jgi:glutathione reductase (NADPH)
LPGYDFDYFVIGAGSGGVRSARIAAAHGARVAIAEDGPLGGTCVNVGCVPKKLLSYAAHFAHDFADAAGFGWEVGPRAHDWARLIANKDAEISRLNGVYRRLLEGAGCTLLTGRASLVDARTVQVGDTRYTAERILLATGGRPVLPDEPGAREHGITSDEAFRLKRLPPRVIVVGGGYIAAEFACIFQNLGAKVTQLHRGPLFLRGFDRDVRHALAEEMRAGGVDLRFSAAVERLERRGGELVARLAGGGEISADAALYAVGRRPNTRGLGLEAAGVALDDEGAVVVDDDFKTSAPNIYAVGDVTNLLNLTPVAIAQGHALADALFGKRPRRVSYANVPTAVFSIPPVAAVGLTEGEARRALGEVDVYKARFKPLRHTLSGREERTMMKLVVDQKSDRVVGVHLVGMDAPEIIQGFAVALNCGATKAQLDQTIGLHPTAAEELVTMRTKSTEPGVAEDELIA